MMHTMLLSFGNETYPPLLDMSLSNVFVHLQSKQRKQQIENTSKKKGANETARLLHHHRVSCKRPFSPLK